MANSLGATGVSRLAIQQGWDADPLRRMRSAHTQRRKIALDEQSRWRKDLAAGRPGQPVVHEAILPTEQYPSRPACVSKLAILCSEHNFASFHTPYVATVENSSFSDPHRLEERTQGCRLLSWRSLAGIDRLQRRLAGHGRRTGVDLDQKSNPVEEGFGQGQSQAKVSRHPVQEPGDQFPFSGADVPVRCPRCLVCDGRAGVWAGDVLMDIERLRASQL